jgi:hypothetical protein
MREASADFDLLSAVRPLEAGRFEADVPDHWQQGRGAYGGLVTAILVRALEAMAPGRPLRSLTCELCGPTQPGLATLEAEVLRAGNAVSTVAVRLVQAGEVQAHAVGVLGQARPNTPDSCTLVSPTLGDWKALDVLPVGPPLGPVFGQHLELRTALLPFSGATERRVEGWTRLLRPGATRDAAFLAGVIDAYWSTEFMVLELPRPMATIAFTFQPVGDFAGLDVDAPLFYRATGVVAAHGYLVEFRELWGHDGRLLALNQQTMVLIK